MTPTPPTITETSPPPLILMIFQPNNPQHLNRAPPTPVKHVHLLLGDTFTPLARRHCVPTFPESDLVRHLGIDGFWFGIRFSRENPCNFDTDCDFFLQGVDI